MKTPQILLDAQANWPEDEAALTAQSFEGRIEDGCTADENEQALARDTAHMERVFGEHADSVELTERYFAALKKFLPHMSALNLDAFNDSADITQHVSDLLTKFPSDLKTYVSPIPRAYLDFCSEKARAIDCRKMGLIQEAVLCERGCERIFKTIPALWRW